MANVDTDTITALATPPGRGGIAVIRVSGPLVSEVIETLLGSNLKPRVTACKKFLNADGELIDAGIAVFFPAPNSFTGEDVLELHCHGSPIVVDALIKRLLALDIRMARPGEFSERAFLNGKMDLAQAEAVADLINASSDAAARAAIRSLQGDFSKMIRRIADKLIYLRTYVEAAIDFSDENIDLLTDKKILEQIETLLNELNTILYQAKQSSFLRDGITAVMIGEPNVGKSSLLNALSGRDSAIVTNVPGTTRDVLNEMILLDGMPICIKDTAGLRESDNVIEQEGIRRAYQEMEKADIVLYVLDISRSAQIDLKRLPQSVNERCLLIKNKIDLMGLAADIAKDENDFDTISVSAHTGDGIALLKQQIKRRIGFEIAEGSFLARRRHLDALSKSFSHLNASLVHLTKSPAFELAAEELRQAHLALGEITGEFTSDDLLGEIFASFCIGK